MIYLPGSGILAAYTDSATGELNDEFSNALGVWIWAWFILTVIYTIAAMRSSWVLFIDLSLLSLDLLLLACGYTFDVPSLFKAGNAIGFIVAFLSCEFIPSFFLPRSSNLDTRLILYQTGLEPLGFMEMALPPLRYLSSPCTQRQIK